MGRSMSDREAILASAEELIASAVRLLYPHCGEQTTIGILQQMAEEQARFVSFGRLMTEKAPSASRH